MLSFASLQTIVVLEFLQNRLSACCKPRLCNTSPRPTIKANGPLDEYWCQTFNGVEWINTSYCISQHSLEHQDVDPQKLEDKPGGTPRKEMFKSHPHLCAGRQILEGLVPTELPHLFTAVWLEIHRHQFMPSVRWMNKCQIQSASPQMSVIVYFPFKLVKLQQLGVINMLGPSFHSHSAFSWH